MSTDADVEEVYENIAESARLMGAACSREKVLPILEAFRPALPDAGIVFSVATGAAHAGELDYTITVDPSVGDPYLLARSRGLVAETDHPVGSLLADVRASCSVSEYMIDCGVADGFKKTYAHFPQDPQSVTQLADLASMPPAVAENADYFAKHGLDSVAMMAIDYQNRTTNLYFAQLPPDVLEDENIASMIADLGFTGPDENMLGLARQSFRVYFTLSWDSSKILRICFAHPPCRRSAAPDLSQLSRPVEPEVVKFVEGAPYSYGGERVIIFAMAWAAGGEFYKLGSYFRVSPVFRKLWAAHYKEEI